MSAGVLIGAYYESLNRINDEARARIDAIDECIKAIEAVNVANAHTSSILKRQILAVVIKLKDSK